ncbi:M15 family metallopeptidase [Spartinivicinus marinus]|uniref:M15 family metallopeptidase n=1 Tax=Spartinivicinus marinus TaxID=2994442 RepID=UPI00225249C6|nr:hypothetical protein [Spartinivicinus marinus]
MNNVVHNLPDNLGLLIFDAFRTKETQRDIFNRFQLEIIKNKPHLSDEQLHQEVRKFAAHPDEPSRFAVPPHNSGGSIDLALYDINTQQQLDFGSDFDDMTVVSATDYFENNIKNTNFSITRTNIVKINRRILYHAMTSQGFVNFENEWWHYSLGDCLWAQMLNLDWYYLSLEQEVLKIMGD